MKYKIKEGAPFQKNRKGAPSLLFFFLYLFDHYALIIPWAIIVSRQPPIAAPNAVTIAPANFSHQCSGRCSMADRRSSCLSSRSLLSFTRFLISMVSFFKSSLLSSNCSNRFKSRAKRSFCFSWRSRQSLSETGSFGIVSPTF